MREGFTKAQTYCSATPMSDDDARPETSTVVRERSGPPPGPARIVCVGDVHSEWDEGDERALCALKPDLALFVGDYGNEDVDVTRRIAAFAADCDFGVATVFGNHDAFYTASFAGQKNCPYDKRVSCRVTEQMEVLAPYDVSYRSAEFEDLRLSVCGGRSFSWGGPNWKHAKFYRKFIGVNGMPHSTQRIEAAVAETMYSSLIFLSHSGPTGLGGDPSDPCGKDWGSDPGGDYGDSDLRAGIERARREGIRVPLTVFGHMHKRLQNRLGSRTMLKTEPDGDTGRETVMVNAAVVPRHRLDPHSTGLLHHFQIVQIADGGEVDSVEEAWVSVDGVIAQSTRLYDAEKLAVTQTAVTT